MTEPSSYIWDPDGTAVALRDRVLGLEGTTGLLGTTAPDALDALDESATGYVVRGLELIADWAEHERPDVAVDCILAYALVLYQILHGKPTP